MTNNIDITKFIMKQATEHIDKQLDNLSKEDRKKVTPELRKRLINKTFKSFGK